MQPAIILDLQKELLTKAISASKLFRDLILVPTIRRGNGVADVKSSCFWVGLMGGFIAIESVFCGRDGGGVCEIGRIAWDFLQTVPQKSETLFTHFCFGKGIKWSMG